MSRDTRCHSISGSTQHVTLRNAQIVSDMSDNPARRGLLPRYLLRSRYLTTNVLVTYTLGASMKGLPRAAIVKQNQFRRSMLALLI